MSSFGCHGIASRKKLALRTARLVTTGSRLTSRVHVPNYREPLIREVREFNVNDSILAVTLVLFSDAGHMCG
jgi:hypothetical protein